jgi:hypothetical protein
VVERKNHCAFHLKSATSQIRSRRPVNVTQSTEVANEILNEMQRERGGGVIEEDVSRYSVSLRRVGTTESWTGEIVGHPSCYPAD